MNPTVEPAIRKVESIIEGFIALLPNFALALLALALFFLAGGVAKRVVLRLFLRQGRPDLGSLLGGLAKWGLRGLGLLAIVTIVFPSVQPADALATLGIGSVAIGFAFKDILQNWFAGLLILLRQPFRAGDQIVVKDFEGTVEHIEARATLIKTYDGRRVVIPNSDVYTNAVIVNTAFAKRRSEYDVGIGYGDDLRRAREVILDALSRLPEIEQEPAPDVIPWELAGSSVNLKVRWWTRSVRGDVVASRGKVVEAIRAALGDAGIDLPYPTRVVLFHDQTEEADGDRRRQREGWPAGDSPPRPRHLNEVVIERDAGEASSERAARSDQGGRPPRRRPAAVRPE